MSSSGFRSKCSKTSSKIFDSKSRSASDLPALVYGLSTSIWTFSKTEFLSCRTYTLTPESNLVTERRYSPTILHFTSWSARGWLRSSSSAPAWFVPDSFRLERVIYAASQRTRDGANIAALALVADTRESLSDGVDDSCCLELLPWWWRMGWGVWFADIEVKQSRWAVRYIALRFCCVDLLHWRWRYEMGYFICLHRD
jgi:hypothetical protein